MNSSTRSHKAALASLAAIGLGIAGTYALGFAFHHRSRATADARKIELVHVVSAAAPPQEAAKPTPAPVVGGGQYSPYVGQNYPNRVYWGVAHVHTGFSFDSGMFG